METRSGKSPPPNPTPSRRYVALPGRPWFTSGGQRSRRCASSRARETPGFEGRRSWLGQAAGEDAVPTLIEAMGDANATIRASAAFAMTEIGPPAADAVPALLKALGGQTRWPSAATVGITGRLSRGRTHP